MIRRAVTMLIAGTLIAGAALPGGAAGEASIDWVSYCRGDLQQAKVVKSTEARKLFKGKTPFCVAYEEGFFDPLELRGACDEAAGKPLPWNAAKSVDLLMTLPAGANAADYEAVVSVTASEAPSGCASCDPDPACEPGTKEVKKEYRLTFKRKGERKRWSVTEAMLPGEGREFLSMKATAVLKRQGVPVLQRDINVTWAYCC